MHIFLQGPRNIGKSTVIQKTLQMLENATKLTIAGFFTWNGGETDPHIYMRAAEKNVGKKTYRIASYNPQGGGMNCDISVFDNIGVRLLNENINANLIIMDELGFLESDANLFKQTVMEKVMGETMIFGVLRLGNVPWHETIKLAESVTIYDINELNRDAMPQMLFDIIYTQMLRK